MKLKIRKPFLYLLAASILMGGSMITVRYLKAFNLQEIRILPEKLAGEKSVLDDKMGTNLFMLPMDKITENLLAGSNVHKVKLNFHFPDVLEVHLNDVSPLALMLCRDGRTLYCLDENSTVFKSNIEKSGLDYPIITGLKKYKLYQRLSESSIISIITQLAHIRKTDSDTYHALSIIDVSDYDKVMLRMDGLPFPIITDAGSIQKSITKLKIFLMGQNHDLSQIKKLDLRTDGLIIAVD